MEQQLFCLRYAILAPSSHNAQPWLFHADQEWVDVFADARRTLPVIDKDNRQLIMSCGGALFNLRVAMRRFGFVDEVTLSPDGPDAAWLARVRCGPMTAPSSEVTRLFSAIPHRHTNRSPFETRPVSYHIADELIAAVEAEGAWLVRLHPNDKRAAADLIAAADRVQFGDRAFRRELSHWLTPNHSHRRDGIPGYAKSYGATTGYTGPLLVRTFDIGHSVGSTERALAKGSPLLVVLGTDEDDPCSWLRAGEAMQRMLLVAHRFGLSASFLNQPLELPDFRQRFSALTGRTGYPQLIMRLGYGQVTRATPRRALEDVLLGSLEDVPRWGRAGRAGRADSVASLA